MQQYIDRQSENSNIQANASKAASCSGVRSRFSNSADVTALLAALCFFLSAVEYMLPKPLPFMRLGIANLPILLAVDMLPLGWYMALAAAKVVGMSIISGTLFSYVALFSLAGTITAALTMRGLWKLGGRAISHIGVSIAGAVISNAVQMLIARYVMFGNVAWLIAPVFLATGLVTGTLMGLFAEAFAASSTWYGCATGKMGDQAMASLLVDSPEDDSKGETRLRQKRTSLRSQRAQQARLVRRERYESAFEPWGSAVAGVLAAGIFLSQRGIFIKTLFFLVFMLWAWAAGKRFSLFATLMVSFSIIAANLLLPSGRVLVRIGSFAITERALVDGIAKALTFEGLLYISKASILPGLRLPGLFGDLVANAFRYYDRIIEFKGRIHPATLIRDIDRLLAIVWTHDMLGNAAQGSMVEIAQPGRARMMRSLLLLVLVVLISSGFAVLGGLLARG
ncbi:MAG: Gx transporter family protein [Spirochaetales bacterium]|nr:Gx transporter family protein [Spirochaetales bacterium]